MENNDLRPTVWRTARALSNVSRLRLLREVWKSGGRLSVTELAERLGMAVSTTSQYLRALNARGLISVGRSGAYVYYADGKDRSLPEAQAIQDAFSNMFSQRRLPGGWEKSLLAALRAYSHFRRIDIIRCLASGGGRRFSAISHVTSIPKMSLARHMRMLTCACIVDNANGVYSLCAPHGEVAAALFRIAAAGTSSQVSHFAKCDTSSTKGK